MGGEGRGNGRGGEGRGLNCVVWVGGRRMECVD